MNRVVSAGRIGSANTSWQSAVPGRLAGRIADTRRTEAARRLVLADEAKRHQVVDRFVGAAGAERGDQAADC